MSSGLNTQAGMLRGVIGGGDFSPLDLDPDLWLSDTGSDPANWSDLSGNNNHARRKQAFSRLGGDNCTLFALKRAMPSWE